MKIDVIAAGAHEPILHCPNCNHEIKLTESLAAPLIDATRREYEQRLTHQNAEVAKREKAIKAREEEVSKAKEAVDAAVAELRNRGLEVSDPSDVGTTGRQQAFTADPWGNGIELHQRA